MATEKVKSSVEDAKQSPKGGKHQTKGNWAKVKKKKTYLLKCKHFKTGMCDSPARELLVGSD